LLTKAKFDIYKKQEFTKKQILFVKR